VKGVIVAAGYGTRFLPITRVVPKEMLPIVDRPALDLVVQELVEAGVDDLLVVTSHRKKAIEDWFGRDPVLEAALPGDPRLVPPRVHARFVYQERMTGTGDALLLAKAFAGADPVLVAYPDDLFGSPNVSAQLVETWRKTGRSVLAADDLVGQDVSRYGVLDVLPDGDGLRLKWLVEKPARPPSTLVSYGRYLFTPEFFAALEADRRNHLQGEFYHVGAINALAAAGLVAVAVVKAPRFDTGTPLGYLQTVIAHGLDRPDIGPALRAWLDQRR
jgi:UTP--glucose-1-phosphate uridylyltransferase